MPEIVTPVSTVAHGIGREYTQAEAFAALSTVEEYVRQVGEYERVAEIGYYVAFADTVALTFSDLAAVAGLARTAADLDTPIPFVPADAPLLGLATTQQLLNEITTRIMIDGYAGGGGLNYRTVDGR